MQCMFLHGIALKSADRHIRLILIDAVGCSLQSQAGLVVRLEPQSSNTAVKGYRAFLLGHDTHLIFSFYLMKVVLRILKMLFQRL